MKTMTLLLFVFSYMGMAYAGFIKMENVNKRLPLWETIHQVNEAPVANAGMDSETLEGDTVVLNGSMSYDPDAETLTYQWMAPKEITLSDNTIASPSFIAPQVATDTVYTFYLVVNDGTTDSNTDKVSVAVRKVNKAPVAIACADVEKLEGDTTVLDGSQSYDPEGKRLTYIWTTLNGITLSANQNSRITFTVPRYLNDTILVISLVVNDGRNNSEEDRFSITVRHINIAPLANAGKNQVIDEGKTATLDGSLSYDPEKKPVSYHWSAPSGIALSSATDAKPTFTAPEVSKDTTYLFILVVNDGIEDSAPEQVKVTVRQVNKMPAANAGVDFSVDEGTSAILDGTLSSDADGDLLRYLWTAPEGIALNSVTDVRPTFTAPEVEKDTIYHFSLVVNDGKMDATPAMVSVTVRQVNKMPVANAKVNPGANEGDAVTLDGSLSFDADGDSLIYKWTAPPGVVLHSALSAYPTFTAPEVYIDTVYTFILVVNDGKTDSPQKMVTVSVKNIAKPTYYKVYPNPTTGIVSVDFTRTPEKRAEAILSNMAGSVVKRIEIAGRLGFQVDLTGHSSGLYVLTIQDNNERYNHCILLKRK